MRPTAGADSCKVANDPTGTVAVPRSHAPPGSGTPGVMVGARHHPVRGRRASHRPGSPTASSRLTRRPAPKSPPDARLRRSLLPDRAVTLCVRAGAHPGGHRWPGMRTCWRCRPIVGGGMAYALVSNRFVTISHDRWLHPRSHVRTLNPACGDIGPVDRGGSARPFRPGRRPGFRPESARSRHHQRLAGRAPPGRSAGSSSRCGW